MEKRFVGWRLRCLDVKSSPRRNDLHGRDAQSVIGQPGRDVSLRVLRDGEDDVADRIHLVDIRREALGAVPGVRRDQRQQVVRDLGDENTFTLKFYDVVDEGRSLPCQSAQISKHVARGRTDSFRRLRRRGSVPEDRPCVRVAWWQPLGRRRRERSFRPVAKPHQTVRGGVGSLACLRLQRLVSAAADAYSIGRKSRCVVSQTTKIALSSSANRMESSSIDSRHAGQLPLPAGQLGDIDDQSPCGTDPIHAAMVPTGGQRIVGRACEKVQRFPSRSSAT